MRELIRHERFWMIVITIVVPFGWLYPLLRLTLRSFLSDFPR